MNRQAIDPSTPAPPCSAAQAQQAYLWACTLDVAVRKPGNVSLHSAGHDMRAQQFLDSARASAPALFDPRAGVGARIEAAVRATRAVAGCNTNLGILLLCAPLARAHERWAAVPAPAASTAAHGSAPSAPRSAPRSAPELAPQLAAREALHAALEAVLQALDLDDARAAYRAIATAHPGGLGSAPEQDVANEPGVGLRAAMQLAAGRDLIARQYANGFADVFGLGLTAFATPAPADAADLAQRVQRVYLAWLSTHPDSHIVRKQGEAVARAVSTEAARWRDRLGEDPQAATGADFAAWDASLKGRGLNPGTSADLTVCTLFVAALLDPGLLTLDAAPGTVAGEGGPAAAAVSMERSLLTAEASAATDPGIVPRIAT